MEKLLKFCLSLLFVGSIGMMSCTSNYDYYKKEFTKEENIALAKLLIDGRGWYYQGMPAEQLVFSEASNLDPNYADPHRELGVPYLKRGFAHEFYKHYDKAVELDAKEWAGWRGYLYLYFYRDYKRAIKDFDTLDVLTPNFVDYPQATSVDFMRGIAYMQLEKYDQALAYFDKHILKEKELTGLEYMEPHVFIYKSIIKYKQDKLDEAIKVINIAIGIDAVSADQYYWRAKYYFSNSQNKSALEDIEKARSLFKKGNYNTRNYVEEFYQIYMPDIEALYEDIAL